MNRIEELEKRLSKLEQRNKLVDMNKAWEVSYTRRGTLVLFTYFFIAAYLHFIIRIDPWLNAIVPTLGFLLSTLTLRYFKKIWQRYTYK